MKFLSVVFCGHGIPHMCITLHTSGLTPRGGGGYSDIFMGVVKFKYVFGVLEVPDIFVGER